MSQDQSETGVSQAAEVLWDVTDEHDQDAAELAAYADGDESRLGFFNARTYLRPLQAAAGEVVLETEATGDTHHVAGTYFYFNEDGEFTCQIGDLMQPESGVDPICRFAHAYADDGMELVPKHADEVGADV